MAGVAAAAIRRINSVHLVVGGCSDVWVGMIFLSMVNVCESGFGFRGILLYLCDTEGGNWTVRPVSPFFWAGERKNGWAFSFFGSRKCFSCARFCECVSPNRG